jgi:GNAT superfamily N-acetyltransferase
LTATGPRIPFGITIAEEPFDGPDGARLRGEVSAELRRRYGSDDGTEGDPGAQAWADHLAGFVIARGPTGRAVGCAAVRRLQPDVFELKRMYVRPEARGRRIADALLAAAERLAVERGARRLILQTGTEQPEAMTVYRRNGYETIPPFGEFADSPRSRCFGRDLR